MEYLLYQKNWSKGLKNVKLSYFGIVSESSLPPQSAAPAAQTRLHSILPDATFPTFCPGYIFWCSDGEIFWHNILDVNWNTRGFPTCNIRLTCCIERISSSEGKDISLCTDNKQILHKIWKQWEKKKKNQNSLCSSSRPCSFSLFASCCAFFFNLAAIINEVDEDL